MERDELFIEACKLVVDNQKVSGMFIAREFRIGYHRASKIMDELEIHGIISEFNFKKQTREIMFKNQEQLNEFLSKIII